MLSILRVGNGQSPIINGTIYLTHFYFLMSDLQALIVNVYPEMANIFTKTFSRFQERAILSQTNE